MPGPVPDQRPCGHVFRVGPLSKSSESCGYCTRAAIGKCEDCHRHLCHLHGTSAGAFICRPCWDIRAAARQRALHEAEVAAEAGRVELNASVARSDDDVEILRLIDHHSAEITLNAARAAWVRVVGRDLVKPTHELTVAVGHRSWFEFGWAAYDPGWGWRELDPGKRIDAWYLPGAGEWDGVWFDRDGATFGSRGSLWAGHPNIVALPRGAKFRAGRSSSSVLGARLPNASSRGVKEGGRVVESKEIDPKEYAEAIAAILRKGGR
jgi:hypothetical protein